ncbi:hypothetical protein TNCV_3779041 [Trichonephila clavipes]|nr:hypothetical protein TNCV_3779041 [Trichonephila clavipes]
MFSDESRFCLDGSDGCFRLEEGQWKHSYGYSMPPDCKLVCQSGYSICSSVINGQHSRSTSNNVEEAEDEFYSDSDGGDETEFDDWPENTTVDE